VLSLILTSLSAVLPASSCPNDRYHPPSFSTPAEAWSGKDLQGVHAWSVSAFTERVIIDIIHDMWPPLTSPEDGARRLESAEREVSPTSITGNVNGEVDE